MSLISGTSIQPLARHRRTPMAAAGVYRRSLTGGGTAMGFDEDTTITYEGGSVTIPADQDAVLYPAGTSPALDLDHHAYCLFILPGNPTLYACKQSDYAGIWAATDIIPRIWASPTDDLWLPPAAQVLAALYYLLYGTLPPGASSTTGQYGSNAQPGMPYPSPTALAQTEASGRTIYDTLRSSQRLACGQDGTTLAIANDGTLWCQAPGTASPGTQVTLPVSLTAQVGLLCLAVVACGTVANPTITGWLVLTEAWTTSGGEINRRVLRSFFSTTPAPLLATDWSANTLYEDTAAHTGITFTDPGAYITGHFDSNSVLDAVWVPSFLAVFSDLSTVSVAGQLMALPSLGAPAGGGIYTLSLGVTHGTGVLFWGSGALRVADMFLVPRQATGNATWHLIYGAPPNDPTNTFVQSVSGFTNFDHFTWNNLGRGGTVNGTSYTGAEIGPSDGLGFLQESPPYTANFPSGGNNLALLMASVDIDGSGVASYSACGVTGIAGAYSLNSFPEPGSFLPFGRVYGHTEITLTVDGTYHGNAPNYNTPIYHATHSPELWNPPHTCTYIYAPYIVANPNLFVPPSLALGITPSGGVLLEKNGAWAYAGEGISPGFTTPLNNFIMAGIIPLVGASGSLVPIRAGSTNPGPLMVNGALIIKGTIDQTHVWAGGCCDENATLASCSLFGIDATDGSLYRRTGNLGAPVTLVAAHVIPIGDHVYWMSRTLGAPPCLVQVIHGQGNQVSRTTIDTVSGVATSTPLASFPTPAELQGASFMVAASPSPH